MLELLFTFSLTTESRNHKSLPKVWCFLYSTCCTAAGFSASCILSCSYPCITCLTFSSLLCILFFTCLSYGNILYWVRALWLWIARCFFLCLEYVNTTRLFPFSACFREYIVHAHVIACPRTPRQTPPRSLLNLTLVSNRPGYLVLQQ